MGVGGKAGAARGRSAASNYANVTIKGLCRAALRNTSQDNLGGKVYVSLRVTAGEETARACVLHCNLPVNFGDAGIKLILRSEETVRVV